MWSATGYTVESDVPRHGSGWVGLDRSGPPVSERVNLQWDGKNYQACEARDPAADGQWKIQNSLDLSSEGRLQSGDLRAETFSE
jgi:hypothetical protein